MMTVITLWAIVATCGIAALWFKARKLRNRIEEVDYWLRTMIIHRDEELGLHPWTSPKVKLAKELAPAHKSDQR